MAGRKPKPTAVKKLEGNPGKRKLCPLQKAGSAYATYEDLKAKDVNL